MHKSTRLMAVLTGVVLVAAACSSNGASTAPASADSAALDTTSEPLPN